MPDERTCPFCGESLPWIDGKDKRKYADHVDSHAPERGYTLNSELLPLIRTWRRRQNKLKEGMTRGEHLASYEIQTMLDQVEELIS